MDPRKNSKRQGTRSQGLSKVRRQLKSFFLSSFSQFDVSTNKKKKTAENRCHRSKATLGSQEIMILHSLAAAQEGPPTDFCFYFVFAILLLLLQLQGLSLIFQTFPDDIRFVVLLHHHWVIIKNSDLKLEDVQPPTWKKFFLLDTDSFQNSFQCKFWLKV